VGSLVIGVAQVELQNGLHEYTDGVFLAFKSKNILPQRSRRAMPFGRLLGRYSVRNSHQFFLPETVHGRLILAGCLAGILFVD
jgi:hypothetical protein